MDDPNLSRSLHQVVHHPQCLMDPREVDSEAAAEASEVDPEVVSEAVSAVGAILAEVGVGLEGVVVVDLAVVDLEAEVVTVVVAGEVTLAEGVEVVSAEVVEAGSAAAAEEEDLAVEVVVSTRVVLEGSSGLNELSFPWQSLILATAHLEEASSRKATALVVVKAATLAAEVDTSVISMAPMVELVVMAVGVVEAAGLGVVAVDMKTETRSAHDTNRGESTTLNVLHENSSSRYHSGDVCRSYPAFYNWTAERPVRIFTGKQKGIRGIQV